MLIREGEYEQAGADSNVSACSFDDATNLKIHLLDGDWYFDGTQSKKLELFL
jgi:hypothetical protein